MHNRRAFTDTDDPAKPAADADEVVCAEPESTLQRLPHKAEKLGLLVNEFNDAPQRLIRDARSSADKFSGWSPSLSKV